MDLQKIKMMDELSDDAIVDAEDLSAYFGISLDHVRWLNSQKPSALPTRCKIFNRLIRYKMGDIRSFVRGSNVPSTDKPNNSVNSNKLGRPSKKEIVESRRLGMSVAEYRSSKND